ncbi:MAG TPA: cysteine desulfurase [Caldilineae bacterium]|nr:cysteine desulfurase [Caldilineae bacterium]
MSKPIIYMDHSATTPVDPRVVEAMLPYFTERFGNASSLHRLGREASQAMDDARQTVAEILSCHPHEIIFTSCGTESDNLALRGVALAQRARGRGNHIVTTAIEHHAVLHTAEDLRDRYGFDLTIVPVDRDGLVNPQAVAEALRDDTVLVSVMYANNEVGTIQPLAEIAAITRERGIPFHTDAVQAGGYLPLNVDDLGVDLLSLSAHKFYGPKGVGVLYVRSGTPLWPIQTGGGHERKRRAGTENIPYIVALATALRLAQEEREAETARLTALRDRLIAGIEARIPDVQLTGHRTQRLPGHASFIVRGVEAEGMLMGLDLEGICASSGSACTSGAQEPSHVLTAMGIPRRDAVGHLRLTLGRGTRPEDVDRVLDVLPGIVERLRAYAPSWA